MTSSVVLIPPEGSPGADAVRPIAQRLAEPSGATLETCPEGPPEAILAAAADRGARLIVMCARSPDDHPDGGIGATALAVLRGAPCPVVLVDPSRVKQGWKLGRLLAPHDGSPAVSDALGPAMECAREAGAELIVLQVDHDGLALGAGSIAPLAYVDQVQHTWPAWSGEFLQRLAGCNPLGDLRVRLLVGHGEPAVETFRVADEEAADLIVLVWKGRWEPPHAATLKAMLNGAPCPVMVMRIPAPEA